MPPQRPTPATPRVISPSPELSDSRESLGPVTRSAARKQRLASPSQIPEEGQDKGSGSDSSTDTRARIRSRSRSPVKRRTKVHKTPHKAPENTPVVKSQPLTNGFVANGHLSPYENIQRRWGDFSRSPSPLGLIPLHKHYRSFIHRHEIPRKIFHVSIGFLTLHLYTRGIQTLEITPWLVSALFPIAATDLLRHRFQSVNKLYIRCLGALMRETEVDGYNGVIWYLLGTYVVLRFFSKDVGVMGVLLLSWCDTAASTFGRLWGRHTPHLRPGKSVAGTLAAWAVGALTAAAFWGIFVPHVGTFPNDPEGAFMFTGSLNLLPTCIRGLLGWAGVSADVPPQSSAVISGGLALGVMSVWSGIVAAGSEFVDLFSWDDNLTIPVLSGLGMWGFLKVFG